MHYSAKRGLAIACRLYVCPSVTLVDQDYIGWKSWKLIAQTISPKVIHLLPGEHGEILGRLEVGWEKVACWSTKAAISLKRVKIEEKLLGTYGGPIGSHQRSFEWYNPRLPMTSYSPRLGFTTPNQNSNHYYPRNVWSTDFKFGRSIYRGLIAWSSLRYHSFLVYVIVWKIKVWFKWHNWFSRLIKCYASHWHAQGLRLTFHKCTSRKQTRHVVWIHINNVRMSADDR